MKTASQIKPKLYMQAKQKKEFICWFPPAGRYSAISNPNSNWNKVSWEGKHHHSKSFPSPPPLPQLLLPSMMLYGMEYPFGRFGSVVPSQLLVPALLLAWQHEKQKSPRLCASTAQQQVKHLHIISTILLKKKKSRTQHHISLYEEI